MGMSPWNRCGTLTRRTHTHTQKAIVEELPGDRHPLGVGRGVCLVDVAPNNFLGHDGVQPGNDARVDLEPLRIVEHGGDSDKANNMADETGFFTGEVEEGPPLPEVAIVRCSEGVNGTRTGYGCSTTRGWRLGVELVQ